MLLLLLELSLLLRDFRLLLVCLLRLLVLTKHGVLVEVLIVRSVVSHEPLVRLELLVRLNPKTLVPSFESSSPHLLLIPSRPVLLLLVHSEQLRRASRLFLGHGLMHLDEGRLAGE